MSLFVSRAGLAALVFLGLIAQTALAASPPPVELVDDYHPGLDLSQFFVSEKYDGVRGYWTGRVLLTRSGHVIDTPTWFTAGWPDTAMDGELWTRRGDFSSASTIIRTAEPDDKAWHRISYRVFDLPNHGGPFAARVPAIGRTVAAIDQSWVVAIRQFRVADESALRATLDHVVADGGEGLVLHRASARYADGRHVGLYKLKPYQDAEAKVIAVNPGHGRLRNMMGSLEVRTPDGHTFAIGSGFTDSQRADPPPIGSWITYRFTGRTANGLPRFARFLHRRPGGPPPEPTAD